MIFGLKDSVLDSNSLAKSAKKHEISVSLFSEGHMSHIENKTECLNGIMHFIKNI